MMMLRRPIFHTISIIRVFFWGTGSRSLVKISGKRFRNSVVFRKKWLKLCLLWSRRKSEAMFSVLIFCRHWFLLLKTMPHFLNDTALHSNLRTLMLLIVFGWVVRNWVWKWIVSIFQFILRGNSIIAVIVDNPPIFFGSENSRLWLILMPA
jgi:hypothetical protein